MESTLVVKIFCFLWGLAIFYIVCSPSAKTEKNRKNYEESEKVLKKQILLRDFKESEKL